MSNLLKFEWLLLLPEIYYILILMLLVLYSVNLKLLNSMKIIIMLAIELLVITFILNINLDCVSQLNFVYNDLTNIVYIASILYLFSIMWLLINYKIYTFEFIILILTSIFGMILLIKSNDLISMYLSIELQSMGMYVLATYNRISRFGTESGLKYYIMGSLSSCIQLLGIALIYGLSGTTNYLDINYLYTLSNNNIGITTGFILIIIGLIFKLGGAPFHMWLPDVYQGAPLASTSFFAIVPKISIVIALFNLLNSFNNTNYYIKEILFIIIILSILIGTLQGLVQNNIKRLFAYSSISHVGFILIGLFIGTIESWLSTIFYIIIYILMTLGIFNVLITFKNTQNSNYYLINNWKNLANKNPILTLSFSILLFSLAGVPPLAGFYSKYYILYNSILTTNLILPLIAILGSAIATVYYITIIKLIYFKENLDIPYSMYLTSQTTNCYIISSVILFLCTFLIQENLILNILTNLI